MGTNAPSLSADLGDVRRRLSNLERSPRLGRSTVDSGKLVVAGDVAISLEAVASPTPTASVRFAPVNADDKTQWPSIGTQSALPPGAAPDAQDESLVLTGGYTGPGVNNKSTLVLETADVFIRPAGAPGFTLAGSSAVGTLDVSGVRLSGTATEWQCHSAGSAAYVPIRASSFPTGSSREIKQDVIDIPFDTVKAIKAARAQQWAYKPEYASENGQRHIGPMAEDLPAALVTEVDGVKTVDLLSLVGTLWDAVSKIADRLDAIEAKLA